MATPVQMPALSPTMKEGKIVKWLKQEGDKVKSGEAIAECETDKSNLEIEAYDDGYLLKIAVPEGGVAPVGAPIAFVGAKGEKVDGTPATSPAPKSAAAAPAPAAPSGDGIAVVMPALSPTMKEGKIVKWLKQEGDKVKSGDALAECETDKSNLEIEAYDDGTLSRIVVGEGQMAAVGAPIAYLAGKGAPAQAPAAAPRALASVPAPPRAPAAPPPAPQPAARAHVAPAVGGRLRASPLAKRMARERGLDLQAMRGSGPLGRIVKKDVEAALTQAPAATPRGTATVVALRSARGEPEAVPVSTMRRVISQRMAEVKPGVPHFYLSVEVEMDAALKIREEAKALESKVSVNDILIKAAAIALRRYPKMNVSLQGDSILHFQSVDIGVAVAIEEGLITPVIRDADQKGLSSISSEARDLAERARRRALKPAEYTGGSLTVSNLGMFGIDSFIAVINPPQAAILAVGAVAEKAVVRSGQLAVRKMMTITLSGDHRVIDGAIGAEYLRELKNLLEHPMRLLF